jgi:LacI family gluconate utilization system Gnt-I transcriptional repressor
LVDVAIQAGVSTMTVARVLRDPNKVAPGTRERVARALAAANYTPDLVARALASRRSGVVGAIVPTLSNSLIADVIQGMTDELARDGRQLMIAASGFSAEREETLVRSFLSRRVDAIYLTGTSHAPSTVALLRAAGLPVVEGGNIPERPIDMAVGVSNRAAAAAVVRHLLMVYGADTDIAYFGASPFDNDRMRDRAAGYIAALSEQGRVPDPARMIVCPMSMEGGRVAMTGLLEAGRMPRAIFCATDVIAVGAVFECVRRGIDVPGRLAIAGYDDLDLAREVVPALTSVRVPRYEIGHEAARMFNRRLAGQRPERAIVEMGFELIRRASA